MSFTVRANNKLLQIRDSAYSSGADLKASLNGIMLIYELATPTEETADPYTNPQSVDPYGTEEYVTDGVLAVGHETSYLGKIVSGLMGSFRPSEETAEEPTEETTEEPIEENEDDR
jgi:hypothetical protein